MNPSGRIWLIAAIIPSLGGCVSGRVWSVDVTDRAVIVRDERFPTIAIVRSGNVEHIGGAGVASMDADARWVVVTDIVFVPGTILMEPGEKDSVRIPYPSMRQILTAVRLDDGRRFSVPNTLEEDDWAIDSVVVCGDSLFAKVGPRYSPWIDSTPDRHWRRTLPDGAWKPVAEDEWTAADAAAKSRVACPTQSPPWSVPVGGHGTLWVNRDGRTWTTTIVAPETGTTIVLRQNVWEPGDVGVALTDAMPGHWP